MDYGRTSSELDLLDQILRLAAASGDEQHRLGLASAGRLDPGLDAALRTPEMVSRPLQQRLLVVEEAARLGLPAMPGAALLVAADLLDRPLLGPVAVIDRRRPGPSRIAPDATLAIVLDDPVGWVADLRGRGVSRVESSFGYPFSVVDADEGAALGPSAVELARSRWHLALAAEIAGTASGALAHVVDYLRGREQFGRPLATFQALRHRVAELAVSTEAALWLAREAAWHDDPRRSGLAIGYARDLAAAMAPEVVQLCGARGFTLEHPVHLFAMRLEGLRLEVGAADRLAASLLAR